MARFQLNAASGGINRQRTKGGPKPDNLYDILNGYVDASGGVVSRPGTVEAFNLPEGTKGLCVFNGGFVVFSHKVVDGLPDGVSLQVLAHPGVESEDEDPPVDDDEPIVEIPIREIHYAGPFLGALYVTAEFEDGAIADYWLQQAETWQANTVYMPTQLVQPVDPNGLVYKPTRVGEPKAIWAPNVERKVGDVVEPTTFNGYEYVVITADGIPPRSGSVEPDWATKEGAVTIEEADVTPGTDKGQQNPGTTVPPRYDNPGGSTPRAGGGSSPGTRENQAIQ